MFNKDIFKDIAHKLGDSLPEGLGETKKDLENNFNSVLQAGFSKMHVVSREEYDVQVAALERYRQKIAELEERIKQLEEK